MENAVTYNSRIKVEISYKLFSFYLGFSHLHGLSYFESQAELMTKTQASLSAIIFTDKEYHHLISY